MGETVSVWSSLIQLDHLLFKVLAFVPAMVLHDWLQASLALLLGDRTPREQGRLTANPLAHVDLLGTLMLLFGPYGWSKPISIRLEELGAYARAKAVMIYSSGPLLHLVLGLLFWWQSFQIPFSAPDDWSMRLEGGYSLLQKWPDWVVELLRGIIYWNYIVHIMLFIVNLIPFYPTDGWKIIASLVPKRESNNGRWQNAAGKLQLISMLLLIGILATPIGRLLLGTLFQWWSSFIMHMF
jgi:Zn-dependent protease